MNSDKARLIELLADDLPSFCEKVLQVRNKAGGLSPFKLNAGQKILHEEIEKQVRETGKARIIVVKARQLGISTYISARFYHKVLYNTGCNAYVFAHDTDSSHALFNMVKLYNQESLIDLYPKPNISNTNQIVFNSISSKYRVGTAGSKGLGRGMTNQLCHWSEVAFSPNAEQHIEGLLQTVANQAGTEVILESTANGMGDVFHQYAMAALNGESAFKAVFLPYYTDPTYTMPLYDGFELSAEKYDGDVPSEQEYYIEHAVNGMTKEHLLWRRMKIQTDFNGNEARFRQEYPADILEAFAVSSGDSYIQPSLIQRSHKTEYPSDNNIPLIMGVDPARQGKDQFAIALRRGREIVDIFAIPKEKTTNTTLSTQAVIALIERHKPDFVNIDAGSFGIAIYDNLRAQGYGKIVHKVDFGGQASDNIKWFNKSSEMFDELRLWLEDEPNSMQKLSDEMIARLMAQICHRQVFFNAGSRMQVESKQKFKTRLKYSPDEADALMLTFATKHSNVPNALRSRQAVQVKSKGLW